MSTRIRHTARDTWAIGQLRAMGQWETSEAALRDRKTTSARLVALGLARAIPSGEPGFMVLLPIALH